MVDVRISEDVAHAQPNISLPKLHFFCYHGNLQGVLDHVSRGRDLHATTSVTSQQNQVLHGVTALFLAAQQGHLKVCKLLVENGANPNQPAYIHNTTNICTPADVARLNLHMSCARYLAKVTTLAKTTPQLSNNKSKAKSRASEHVSEDPKLDRVMHPDNCKKLTPEDEATKTVGALYRTRMSMKDAGQAVQELPRAPDRKAMAEIVQGLDLSELTLEFENDNSTSSVGKKKTLDCLFGTSSKDQNGRWKLRSFFPDRQAS